MQHSGQFLLPAGGKEHSLDFGKGKDLGHAKGLFYAQVNAVEGAFLYDPTVLQIKKEATQGGQLSLYGFHCKQAV